MQDVYDGFHRSQRTGLFEPENVNKRFGLKAVVIGVRLNRAVKAYPLNKAFWKSKGKNDGRLIQDMIADIPILTYHDPRSYFTAVFDLRDAAGSSCEFSEPPEGKMSLDTDGVSWNLLTGQGPGNTVPQVCTSREHLLVCLGGLLSKNTDLQAKSGKMKPCHFGNCLKVIQGDAI